MLAHGVASTDETVAQLTDVSDAAAIVEAVLLGFLLVVVSCDVSATLS